MSETLGTKGPKILLYSNHSSVRSEVRFAVGDTVAGASVEWLEVATYEALWEIAEKGNFDLFILDGEAHKVGGMGISRELKESLYDCPPILLLTGRAQDAWLASWSLADDAVPRPLDVFAVQDAVQQLLSKPSTAVAER
ncbi:response regulator [Jonesiaceae bacterium BS-20]|uniref:Response regulator n=1 Tax=Jonesiaceae bacterium BS-20 TaxID=3120821 RepID=A0AAU7E0B8_9MICO